MMKPFTRETLHRLAIHRLSKSGVVVPASGIFDATVLAGKTGCRMLVVISRFDLQAYCQGCFAVLNTLSHSLVNNWYDGFTPAVYMAGNPAKLKEKLAFNYLTPDASAGWIFRTDGHEVKTDRLLKLLRTRQKYVPADTSFPIVAQGGGGKQIYIRFSISDLPLHQQLIHITHTLMECIIENIISASDILNISFADNIMETDPVEIKYTRVHYDSSNTGSLKLYAVVV